MGESIHIFRRWHYAAALLFLMTSACEIAAQTRSFDLEAGNARSTLRDFARQANVSVVMDRRKVQGVQTNEVSGLLVPKHALARMLEGTPLVFNEDMETGAFAVTQSQISVAELTTQGSQPRISDSEHKLKKTTPMNKNNKTIGNLFKGLFAIAFVSGSPSSVAQDEGNEKTYSLSPFQVDASEDKGYRASGTLAGTRINTRLDDIGSAVSVLTSEFMDDIGGYDNETVLAFALGAEIAGPSGNFTGINPASDSDQGTIHEEGSFGNPSSRNRIRGLTRADSTRNLYLSDIPWDGYITDRIDIQRGPNAMLFGLGEPAGVINASTLDANFGRNRGKLQIRFDQFGSLRFNADYNVNLIKDQLAARIAVLSDDQKFRRNPAFEEDDRKYIALKYVPKLFNSETTRFELSANFENGSIESNRPRSLPPADYLSQFFRPVSEGGMGKATINYNIQADRDINGDIPGVSTLFERGVQYSSNAGFQNTFGADFIMSGLNSRGTLRPDGSVANNTTYGRNVGSRFIMKVPSAGRGDISLLSPENQVWNAQGKLVQQTFQDTDIFDAFNVQFDGGNKREFRDWDALQFELTNTFFSDRVGINIGFYNEKVDTSQYALMNANNQRVYVDIMETYIDPTINSDGSVSFTPNPNVGRPYIQHTLGTANERFNERNSVRINLFAEYDFNDRKGNWFSKLLGKHRVNYLNEQQEQRTDSRGQRPGGFGPEFYDAAQLGRNYGQFAGLTNFRQYLGDQDLRTLSSVSEVRLNTIAPNLFELSEGPVSVRYWDRTWTGNDPGAEWISPDGEVLTQSANLANYAGWTTDEFKFYNLSNRNRVVEGAPFEMTASEYLTQTARLSQRKIRSNVFVLQSQFWNNSIIGTYGYREDVDRGAFLNADNIPNFNNRTEDLSPEAYNYDLLELDEAEGDNTNWSVMAHINRLLGEKDILPVRLSLFYNEGENQTSTGSNTRDILNRSLGDRRGETVDRGIILGTKSGKYSLRITEYETSVINEVSGLGSSFRPQQTLANSSRLSKQIKTGELDLTTFLTPDEETHIRNVAMPAWDALMVMFETDPLFQGFQEQLITNGRLSDFTLEEFDENGVPTVEPTQVSTSDVRITRNIKSSGYEFEFTANPTDNWRITMNAAKTKAIISDSPGVSMDLFFDTLDNAILNTAAGEMLSNTGGESVRDNNTWSLWRPVVLGDRALNGLSQPEISEWRYNMITNYSFNEGKLKGFGIGGSFRYQEAPIVDYALINDPDAGFIGDQSRPFYGNSQKVVGLFASYRMKLRNSTNWRIQINANNIFGENKFIPIAIDADGTAAAVRVQEGSSWSITNTFEF